MGGGKEGKEAIVIHFVYNFHEAQCILRYLNVRGGCGRFTEAPNGRTQTVYITLYTTQIIHQPSNIILCALIVAAPSDVLESFFLGDTISEFFSHKHKGNM